MNQRRNQNIALPGFMVAELNALQRDERGKIICANLPDLQSGDIDTFYKKVREHSNATRWDYILFRNSDQRVWYVEFHEGTSDGYSDVVKKLQWLKIMINDPSTELCVFRNLCSVEYFWLRTGKNMLHPASKQAKQLAKNKELKYQATLTID